MITRAERSKRVNHAIKPRSMITLSGPFKACESCDQTKG
jgi:hypothetical protein